MSFVLPNPPLLLLPANDARKQAGVSRVVPEERQVGRGGCRQLGSDLGLDFGQAGVRPPGGRLGGAVARVVGVVLLFSGQVGAPLCIQTMKRKDTDLWKYLVTESLIDMVPGVT